jgi:hypothetical protein
MVGTCATTQAAVGGAEHDGMPAGVARSPKADAGRVTPLRASRKEICPVPIRNLPPGIDVTSEVMIPAARPEIAMIVNKDDETRCREGHSETLKAMFFGARKAVGDGDSGVETIPFGQE